MQVLLEIAEHTHAKSNRRTDYIDLVFAPHTLNIISFIWIHLSMIEGNFVTKFLQGEVKVPNGLEGFAHLHFYRKNNPGGTVTLSENPSKNSTSNTKA